MPIKRMCYFTSTKLIKNAKCLLCPLEYKSMEKSFLCRDVCENNLKVFPLNADF